MSYDYCHLYANGIKAPPPNDVLGGVAGTHNLAASTDPKMQNFLNYTPRFTLTFQPVGAVEQADTALNNYIPALGSTPISVGVATNFPGIVTAGLISEIQGWITNNGYDINSMGLSNTAYSSSTTNPGVGSPNTLIVQYTAGNGSAAHLTITGTPATSFAITVTGAAGDNFSMPPPSTGLTVSGATSSGSSTISFAGASALYYLAAGNTFQISGDANTYTVSSSSVGPLAGLLPNVNFTPALQQNEANGAGVTFGLGSATIAGLKNALQSTRGKYSAIMPQPCDFCSWISQNAMLAEDLNAISAQDVKTSPYTLVFNQPQFLTDELTLSKTWLNANLTGLSSTFVYLYPGQIFDPGATLLPCGSPPCALESYPATNGFNGPRGNISMQYGRDGLVGAFDGVASNGVDSQGLTAYSLAGWASLTPTQLAQTIQAAVEKSSVWGVPFTLYWQPGYLSNQQLTNIVNDLAASGATVTTNASLVATITGKTQYSGTYDYAWAPDAGAGVVNLLPTYRSPTINAGVNMGPNFSFDLNGIAQQRWRPRWDIGASSYADLHRRASARTLKPLQHPSAPMIWTAKE